jgi:hypothetical protein
VVLCRSRSFNNYEGLNLGANLTVFPISYKERGLGPFSHIARLSQRVFETATLLLSDSGDIRHYGVLTILSDKWSPLMLRHVPDCMSENNPIDLDKLNKYTALSEEKIFRLLVNHRHSTSYQSRDPEAIIRGQAKDQKPWGKWGGAILCTHNNQRYFLSFSGLPELWDEAMMFALAIKLGWIKKSSVLKKISPKRNPHLRPLLEACHWTD